MNRTGRIESILQCPECRSRVSRQDAHFSCIGCGNIYKLVNEKSLLFITDLEELRSNHIERPVFHYDYGPQEKKIIEEFTEGVILEVGSGINTFKDRTYDNVILMEIYPYTTTDVVSYAENLPFTDNSVDAVICNAVVEHLKDPFKVLKEFHRVVKPGGFIKIDTNFIYPYHSSPDHYFNMSISGIRELCKDFSEVDAGVGPHQLPCYGLKEILARYLAGTGDVKERRRISRMSINDFLYFMDENIGKGSESHLNPQTIIDLAAGVYYIGRKKKPGSMQAQLPLEEKEKKDPVFVDEQAGKVVGGRVSVVIPCFNHGKYLAEAVESVFNSTYGDYEIVVVNDGSDNPETLKVFQVLRNKYKGDGRIRFIDQGNQGLAVARNNGIIAATGKYILPLDSDNKIRPGYMEKAVAVLRKNPEVGVVYAYARFFGERKGIWEMPDYKDRSLLLGNFIDACSIYRKKLWEDCEGYDPYMGVMGYEDWDLWLSAVERGWKFHLVKEVLFDYRVASCSMINRCNVDDNRRYLIKYITKKHEKLFAGNLQFVLAEQSVQLQNFQDYIQHLESRNSTAPAQPTPGILGGLRENKFYLSLTYLMRRMLKRR